MSDVKALMDVVSAKRASDLHLNPGRPAVGRLHGRLVALSDHALTDACHFANPKQPTKAEYEAMFAEALG